MKTLKTVFVLLILCSILFTCLAVSFHNSPEVAVTANANLDDVTVWHVGNFSDFRSTLEEFQLLGAQTKQYDELIYDGLVLELNEFSVILFESSWLDGQKDNPEFHNALKNIINTRAKLISIGEPTSKLFEVLDNAGIFPLGKNEDGTVRNPASNNPLIVGFKLKQAMTPTGEQYDYSSIFAANGENMPPNLEGLISWTVDSNEKTQ
jgi:hypothetical protein